MSPNRVLDLPKPLIFRYFWGSVLASISDLSKNAFLSLQRLPGPPFGAIYVDLLLKMRIWGSPLDPTGLQNRPLERPGSAKKSKTIMTFSYGGGPGAALGATWAPKGSLEPFLSIWGPTWVTYGSIFDGF